MAALGGSILGLRPAGYRLDCSRFSLWPLSYHLPRIKLAFQRAGVQVFTVPAHQGRLLGQIPFNMAREIAAF